MEDTNLFTNELDLAEWLEEIEIGTARYWNLKLVKYESIVIVLKGDEEILAKIEIADQNYYNVADKIDTLTMCY